MGDYCQICGKKGYSERDGGSLREYQFHLKFDGIGFEVIFLIHPECIQNEEIKILEFTN